MNQEELSKTFLGLGSGELGLPFLSMPNIERFGKPIHKNKSEQRRERRKSQRSNRR